jgi:hypothetical protein
MVVKVKGRINDDGRTGTANQIIYEDEIEGPVQGLTGTATDPTRSFTIFGVPVTVSSTDTFFDTGLTFATLQNDDNVEVSGHFNGQAIQATYLKLDNDNDAEIKGVVSNVNGNQFTLTSFFGAVVNVTVDLTAVPTPIIPQEGQYVEVEGIPTGGNNLEAFRVELEDRHHLGDDEGEIEIYGLLTKNGNGDWFVNDIPLDMDGFIEYKPASLENDIDNLPPEGLMVKVNGDYRNGLLVVDKIEDKQDSLEFKGDVAAISASDAKNGTVTISFGNATGTVTVSLNNSTLYPDDDSTFQFDLRNVRQGDYVEVKAMQDQGGQITATLFDVDDSVGEYEVEGPLDNFSGSSITAMNVTFTVDGGTTYLPRTPVSGDSVDITDLDRDGTAETVEIED